MTQKLWVLLSVTLLAICPPASEASKPAMPDLVEIRERLEDWDLEAAARLADSLGVRHPADPELKLMRARVRYYQGRYAEALELVRSVRSPEDNPLLEQMARQFESMLLPVVEAAGRFREHRSEHFAVFVAPGPDQVMVAEALRVLEASWSLIGADFGVFPRERVRVEIYSDAESFQQASTLTREQIETSGTIALCKFGRIMILSPRLVLRGYPWCRTLAHEYTHYVLWKRNGPSVPIWLHEGVARFEETRWLGEQGADLEPFMKDVLADALREDRLVSFDEMHPSFALLDDPLKVVVAGAEVLAVVRSFIDLGGYALLHRILDELDAGADWRGMFEAALDMPFERFFADFKTTWSARLEGHGDGSVGANLLQLAEDGHAHETGRKAREDGSHGTGEQGEAERLLRLAEILAERGERLGDSRFHQAAAIEYGRAAEAVRPTRGLLNNWARELERSGQLERAERVLERSSRLEPARADTWKRLGRVRRGLGGVEAAAEALTASFRINPFDPTVHELLAELHGALGDDGRRQEALVNLELLQTPSPEAKP